MMTEETEVTPATEQTPPGTDAGTITEIDGPQLRQMFEAATHWLEHHTPRVNALNVFPVPDGDTGTNMLLTMQSAVRELGQAQGHAGEIAQRVARGALMGARGNSGVILSQILRGFARALETRTHITAEDFAAAMRRGAEMAYKAVVKPVEGTILTVIREAADGAEAAVKQSSNLLEVLHLTLEAARRAEANTPEFLAVLREAGVTDSGGEGLVVILDGALKALRGEKLATGTAHPALAPMVAASQGGEVAPGMRIDPETGIAIPEGEWGYDIQYLIRGENLDVEKILAYISSIGDCPLVVGDETLVKVHVHCPNPGPAIEFGANQGVIFDVVIENMDEQAEAFGQGAPAQPAAPAHPAAHLPTRAARTDETLGIGTVVVAPGVGLRHIFESMGASQVIDGGQSMNPSTQDLLDAIAKIEAEQVLILPNNKNIILAAEQARLLSDRKVQVIPSKSVPQGIAALLSLNFAADFEANVEAMTEAVGEVETGEITTAVRNTTVNGINITNGQLIGIHNGQIVVAGDDLHDVVSRLLKQIVKPRHEIVSFYRGSEMNESESEALLESLRGEFPKVEIEQHEGGQPLYHYIFSVE